MMGRRARDLAALCAYLRGEAAPVRDWNAVVALANRVWLTPALHAGIRRARCWDDVPEGPRDFLAFIHERCCVRDGLMRQQLVDAIGVLNADGITPTLLKGAASLYCHRPEDGDGACRITSDLDVGVERSDLAGAEAALKRAGYHDVAAIRGLARSGEPALLEVRARLLPPEISSAQAELEAERRMVVAHGVRALVPSNTSRAFHWLRHDLIKEGDYLRVRLDMRHLCDLALLSREEGGIDWRRIKSIDVAPYWMRAVESQQLMLSALFGPDVLAATEGADRRARMHHLLRRMMIEHPAVFSPLRLSLDAAWGARRLRRVGRAALRQPSELPRRIGRLLFHRAARI